MSIKAVFFDLDGTLLPMDYDAFIKRYFGLLAKRLAPLGYETKKLMECMWAGVGAMVKNDGSHSNEEAFWKVFTHYFGEESIKDKSFINEFYAEEFNKVKEVCGFAPEAKEIIEKIKQSGKKLVLATNPLFPASATENRIRWAGMEPEDFCVYTTYESCSYCKPNPQYYVELAKRIGCDPKECLMVGNDVTEDLVAENIGMKVFLLTDCAINKEEKDVSRYPQGGFKELKEYLETYVLE